jgi:hypothetical protein
MPVQTLILRLEKGVPLTAGEHDDNLKKLRDAINGLESLVLVTLDEDGNIREGLLSGAALTDLTVALAKLEADFISDAVEKTTPVGADITLIGDSADSFKTKKILLSKLGPLVWSLLVAAAEKDPPIGADLIPIGDSADGNVTKVVMLSKLGKFLATSGQGASFTSTLTGVLSGLSPGAIINAAHGLDAKPRLVRGVLVCDSADNNYTAGDEIDVPGLQSSSDNVNFLAGASASNVFLVARSVTTIQALDKTSGGVINLDASKWKAKVYATL